MLPFYYSDAASCAQQETKAKPIKTKSVLAILKIPMFLGKGVLQNQKHEIHRLQAVLVVAARILE